MENTFGLIGQTLGQYRIIEQIGEGGMATVFKAYQPGLNREVALKVLPPHFAQYADFTERFGREAQAIGNLHHPNILPVYDSGQEKGYSYLVMRYIPHARTLAHEMKSPLKTDRLIEVISQIGGALDHAHKAGIIHRDVKPSNVLLDGQWALLSDFGLAKMVENPVELTGTGVGMGTPAYMSPEQGMGKKVDQRTDVYALGIILYEMLTGQVPHRAETPIATVMKRINEPLPLPRSLNPNVPEAVERVLLKALAVDPADRFASAGELATALKTAFGPEPHEVMAGVSPADVTPTKTAPSPPAEKTRVAALPARQGAPGKLELPTRVLGFGAVGLLLVLLLVAGTVFVAFQMSSTHSTPTPEVVGQSTVTVQVLPEENRGQATPPVAPTHTPTPAPTAKETALASSGDTLAEPTSSSTLAPATPPIEPEVTVASVEGVVTAPPVVIAALTGQEAYEVALVEAQKWQPDALLSEISTTALGPLNAEGKSTDWTLKFWSPSTKQFNSMMFFKGELTSSPSNLPVPQAVAIDDTIILDTQRLYQVALTAGAVEYTDQGYAPMAALTPYPLDETRLTWYFNYMGGDYRVVYTVIIDAKTGEVIQAISTE